MDSGSPVPRSLDEYLQNAWITRFGRAHILVFDGKYGFRRVSHKLAGAANLIGFFSRFIHSMTESSCVTLENFNTWQARDKELSRAIV